MRIWILMRARNDTIMVRMSVCYEFRSEWIRMQGQVSGVLEDLGQVIQIRTAIEFLVKPARKRSGGGAGGGGEGGVSWDTHPSSWTWCDRRRAPHWNNLFPQTLRFQQGRVAVQ